MKVLLSSEGGCGLGLFCKSVTDLAWLTPLVSAFKAEIQVIKEYDSEEQENNHPQLSLADMTDYSLYVVVQFKAAAPEHLDAHLKNVHTFIRIVSKEGMIEGDEEDRPSEDQYIFETNKKDKPVQYTNIEQLPEYQPL